MSRKNRERSLSRLLFIVHRAQAHHLKKKFANPASAINIRQWLIIDTLYQKDGLTQQEIAQNLLKDKSVVARQIDAMAQEGLIERRDSPNDQRCNRIYLTDRAKALKPYIEQIMSDHNLKMQNGLSQQELLVFKQIMNKIFNNIIKTNNTNK